MKRRKCGSQGPWALAAAAWFMVPVPAVNAASRPTLKVAYFTPAGREPLAGRQERLERVLEHVRAFYCRGMEENGHGPLTFDFERDGEGHLRMWEVRGREPAAAYGRNDGDKVRREVCDALRAEGMEPDRETILIFQVLLEGRDGRAVEVGPYAGGGGPGGGTAWVYDDERVDARLLPSREPGGWYNGPCSIGRFDTHYIGGVAHELGHAFGLPHDSERASERRIRGRSLMGGGNHTYGEELRGEGPGTFLSPASTLPRSVHPLFTGVRRPADGGDLTLERFVATSERGRVRLEGRLRGSAVGVVAHNNPESRAGTGCA